MNITDLFNGAHSDSILKSISQELNLDESQAKSALGSALPVLLAGLTKNAQTSDGAASLNTALESKHDGSIFDNLSQFQNGAGLSSMMQDGQGILGHIFGGKKTDVEDGISKRSGLNKADTAKFLAILAPLVMGYLGKKKRETNTTGGGLGDLLGGILGETKPNISLSKPKQGRILGMVTGFLDKDKDGDIVDDLLGNFLK